MTSLHADIHPSVADAAPGQEVRLTVTVSNLSTLIDGYSVRVFGLDPEWVSFEPRRLSLFPNDIGQADIRIALPSNFPAGVRLVAIYVQSENNPSDFVISSVALDVATTSRLTLGLDPQSQTGGAKAQYGLVLTNHGNSPIDAVPDAVDPEEQTEFVFTPASVRLMPGEQTVVQVATRSPRHWLGAPKVRVLTFGVHTPARIEAIGTLIQRPRIGRSLITLLGLITAAAVFAAVLSRTLAGVVDRARVGDKIIEQALANGTDGGPTVVANPGSIAGTVRAGSSGTPLAGVEVGLFTNDNGTSPVKTSSSSQDGSFHFSGLAEGTYRVKFSGAGFRDSWWLGGRNFAEGADIKLAAGQNVNLDNLPPPDGAGTGGAGAGTGGTGAGTGAGTASAGISLAGLPGTVSGTVIADNPAGATATLVVQGRKDPQTPAVVAQIDVSANGTFALTNIPTPQTYTLVVERKGNATETRTIDLGPGASATGIEIKLRIGEGVVSGTVTANGAPFGGALIEASDGANVVSTVSLTEGNVGTYALRNLAVPGVYTITVSAHGYTTSSQIVELKDQQPTADLPVFLTPSQGVISGTVRDRFGPLGGVTVTVDGKNGKVTTTTASQGTGVGTYSLPQLDIPASYTVTFSKVGYLDQVRLITLDPLAGSPGTIDAVLRPTAVSVIGRITRADGSPAAFANVSLSSGTFVRSMLTASSPAASVGQFEIGAVPPGSYTFSASLTGTDAIVFIVNVAAGQELVDLGTLALGRQATITGTVTWNGTQPAGAEVRLYLPADFPPAAGTKPVAAVPLDPTGHFQFVGINAPASYVIAVFSNSTSLSALASDVVTSQPGVDVPYNFTGVVP